MRFLRDCIGIRVWGLGFGSVPRELGGVKSPLS